MSRVHESTPLCSPAKMKLFRADPHVHSSSSSLGPMSAAPFGLCHSLVNTVRCGDQPAVLQRKQNKQFRYHAIPARASASAPVEHLPVLRSCLNAKYVEIFPYVLFQVITRLHCSRNAIVRLQLFTHPAYALSRSHVSFIHVATGRCPASVARLAPGTHHGISHTLAHGLHARAPEAASAMSYTNCSIHHLMDGHKSIHNPDENLQS